MIGASLIGSSGIPNWGGGSNDCQTRPTSGIFSLCPIVGAPHAAPYVLRFYHFCFQVNFFDSWGSPQFIGLGFLSFISIILTEIFGSPFMKNISIIIGLLVGCIVAGAAGYMDSSTINSAPAVTFLWWNPTSFNKAFLNHFSQGPPLQNKSVPTRYSPDACCI